ncbi:DUF6401 family natural product biosynthesis protein [Amycolatopsis anabasis]|uniref:DUF6401 family natural product biosynthesis protein n=1 Tax=Amycolatopsis anabasis TaxID=1840409 RepID=UPI00131E77DD|nr:DUF6401 family natural product biosynthesis protein [Amycolatopsis anabasis]
MSGVVTGWMEAAARRSLARLHDEIGAAGLAAAAALPGLSAVVDQHSAAVRDIVTLGVEGSAAVAGVVLLSGYARGLVDQAAGQGWRLRLPGDLAGWARIDWTTARLLGVCALAAVLDPHSRFAGPDAPPAGAVSQ